MSIFPPGASLRLRCVRQRLVLRTSDLCVPGFTFPEGLANGPVLRRSLVELNHPALTFVGRSEHHPCEVQHFSVHFWPELRCPCLAASLGFPLPAAAQRGPPCPTEKGRSSAIERSPGMSPTLVQNPQLGPSSAQVLHRPGIVSGSSELLDAVLPCLFLPCLFLAGDGVGRDVHLRGVLVDHHIAGLIAECCPQLSTTGFARSVVLVGGWRGAPWAIEGVHPAKL